MGIVVKKVFKAEFWCDSALSLVELFNKFRVGFPAQDSEVVHDAENIWEWIEGITTDHRLAFSFSRPRERDPIVTKPTRFSHSIIDREMTLTEIGHRLATAFDLEVHLGEVVYIKGDDFEYRVVETFRPFQAKQL